MVGFVVLLPVVLAAVADIDVVVVVGRDVAVVVGSDVVAVGDDVVGNTVLVVLVVLAFDVVWVASV